MLIDHIDGVNRKIYLTADAYMDNVRPVEIYREVRTLRRENEELRKFNSFMESGGQIAKGGGKFTERYFILKEGAKIVPFHGGGHMSIIGTLITDNNSNNYDEWGEGFECFDLSELDTGAVFNFNYNPPQVEVIRVDGGGSSTDIFDTDEWRELMAKVNSSGASVNINTSNLAIDGLTEQDITIIQGDTWELEIDYDMITPDSVLEFLIAPDIDGDVEQVSGTVTASDKSAIIKLTADQTAGFDTGRYIYNLWVGEAESREQILRGKAKILKSLIPEEAVAQE